MNYLNLLEKIIQKHIIENSIHYRDLRTFTTNISTHIHKDSYDTFKTRQHNYNTLYTVYNTYDHHRRL